MKTVLSCFAVLCFAALALAAPSNALHAYAEGHTFFNPATGAFEGTAEFTIGGNAYTAASTTVAQQMMPLPNGVIIIITSHTFDFGGGDTITTTDHGRLIPAGQPGLFHLNSHLTISGGTGAFAAARGQLSSLPGGTINFITGEAIWTTAGIIATRP